LILAVVEVNHACHLHQGPKPEPAHKNNSMETTSPRLTAEQSDLIKYAILVNATVSQLKGSLVDHYDQPVFGTITTKYLNRVAVTNIRKALASFQLNPNGKSKYRPLPQGYSVYHHFRRSPSPKFVFKELTRKQYDSQFHPPVNQENHLPENQHHKPEEDMVQFSHNIPNAVNRQGRGTSPLQPTAYAEAPLKTPLFDRGAIGLHNTSDLPSLATRAEVNMDSEAVSTSLLEFNKNVHGTVCDYFHSAKLNSKGLATVTLPGGGGITLFYGSNQIIKNNSQHHALIVLVSHSLPVDNALPFRRQARVVSGDTIIIPLPCGINPEIGKKIKEQLIHETERIGDNHSNLTNSLQAMQAHVQSMGYSVKFMGITIRNLPYALSQDGTFQDTNTLSIDPTGLTPVVTSNSFYCPDTLDGESGPINFNVTG
jgi:hypothetical protein